VDTNTDGGRAPEIAFTDGVAPAVFSIDANMYLSTTFNGDVLYVNQVIGSGDPTIYLNTAAEIQTIGAAYATCTIVGTSLQCNVASDSEFYVDYDLYLFTPQPGDTPETINIVPAC